MQRIITADPHALHVLKNEYPLLDPRFQLEVVHHTTLLDQLLQQGRLTVHTPYNNTVSVTYHDPCYLGRYNGEIDAPRRILSAIGVDLREMARSKLRSRCCGGGGGAPISDVTGERRIPDMRMDDARATRAGLVAVACPNCCTMLEGVVHPRPAIKDVAELLLAVVENSHDE